jgi:hypothetical protein
LDWKEGPDVLLGDDLHDGVGDDPEAVEGVGRNDGQVTLAAGAPLVGDSDHQLAAEDADDLLASVQVHAAGFTGRDAATGVAGDQAEAGIGGSSKVVK